MRAQSINAPCPVLTPATASWAVREIVREHLRLCYPTPPNSLVSQPLQFFDHAGTRRRRLAAESGLETDIYDRVHLGYADKIIVHAAPSIFTITTSVYRRPTPEEYEA